MNKLINFFIIFIVSFASMANAKNNESVSLQLQWFDQFQFAGYYMAKEKGYYDEVGLDVEIRGYQADIDPVEEVLLRKANYATGRASLIVDRSQGKEVVALAAILQSSPLALVSKKSSGITKIDDFKNKRVALLGTENSASLNALLFSQKMSFDDMQVDLASDKMERLVQDKVDIISLYTTNQLYALEKTGVELNVFYPKDYGFDFYNDILFTSKEEIKVYEERTQNFINASLKGWEYAFSHMEETVDVILKKYHSQNKSRESLLYEANELKKLAFAHTTKLGELNQYDMQRVYDIYHIMGFIEHEINMDDFIFKYDEKYFNLTYSESEYLKNKKTIKMCVLPSLYPIEALIKEQYVGIVADIFSMFKKHLHTPLEIIQAKTNEESLLNFKNGKCDIASLTMANLFNLKKISVTTPYLKDNFVILTKTDKAFLANIEEAKDKLFVVTLSSFKTYLNKKFPFLNIVIASDSDDALNMLKKDKAFGYIDVSLVANRIVGQYGYETLKVNMKLENAVMEASIGVNNSQIELLSIFNKLIKTLKEDKVEEIKKSWSKNSYTKVVNYKYLFYFVVIFLLILSVGLFFLIKLSTLKKQLVLQVKKLKESEENLKLTQENLDWGQQIGKIGFTYFYGTTKELRWSIGTHSIFETDAATFEVSVDAIKQFIHKDDYEYATKIYDDSITNKEDRIVEYRIVLKSGDIKHIERRYHHKLDSDGNILSSIGTILDITERKKAELELKILNETLEEKIAFATSELLDKNIKLSESIENFKNILDVSIEGVILLDKDRIIVNINQSGLVGLGYTKKQEVIGKHVSELIHVDDQIRTASFLKLEQSTPYEIKILKKNGDIMSVLTAGSNTLKDGKKIRIVTWIDLTKIKQKEQELLQEQKFSQMGAMLSMIAHQWRQPLAAISSTSASLNLKAKLNKIDKEYIVDKTDKISEFSKHLSTTIDDFRDFFKTNKDKEEVCYSKLVKNVLGIVEGSLAEKNILLIKEFMDEETFITYGNEVKQVILNLIKNAEDALVGSKTTQPQIKIHTYKKDNKHFLSVSDNAGGVPNEIISKIFEPYFSTKHEEDGTGLGLYMCKTIVEEHCGGKISVLNENEGAVFTISLGAM